MYLYQRDITDEYIEQKFGTYTKNFIAWMEIHFFLFNWLSLAPQYTEEKKIQRNPPNILRRNKPLSTVASTIKFEVSKEKNPLALLTLCICLQSFLL